MDVSILGVLKSGLYLCFGDIFFVDFQSPVDVFALVFKDE